MKPIANRTLMLSAACAAVLALAQGPARAETLELMHFWTSGGEAKAMDVIKKAAEAEGIQWKDAAVAGGSGMNAFQVLQSRVAAGNPPAAMQMHPALIRQYAEAGLLLSMDDVAAEQGWDKVLAPDLLAWAKYDGHYVGVPFNMHRPNWLWANKAILDKYNDGKAPATWDEFYAMGDKVKADGLVMLASGGQPWQDLLLWDLVVLGSQGKDFYKKALIEQNQDEIGSANMVAAFDTFRKVLSYTDKDRANRDWNLATAMVMKGDAAMQIMGDWALGEFVAAEKVADKDYVCADSPGTAGVVGWNADLWGFFKGLPDNQVAAQKTLAKVTEDATVQADFNVLKGSVPARIDVGAEKFTPCGQKAIKDREAAIASGSMVASFAQNSAQPTNVRGIYEDVVIQFAADPNMTSQQAVDAILAGLSTL